MLDVLIKKVLSVFKRWQSIIDGIAEKQNISKEKAYITTLVIVMLSLWLCTSILLYIFFRGDAGTAGDSFGAVNALFSGLALSGVVLSLHMQREELRAQREELKLTRQEIQGQKEVWESQKFDNLFFNLLDLHERNVKTIYKSNTMTSSKGATKTKRYGREAIKYTSDRLSHDYQDYFRYQTGNNLDKNSLDAIYTDTINSEMHILGHYFRQLYRISLIIHDNDSLKQEEKKQYFKIFASQLSTDELLLLFFNCSTEYGKNFKVLIEEYSMFEHIKPAIIKRELKPLMQYYSPQAFQAKD